MVLLGTAAPPRELICLGGGPKDAGSFSVDNGRDTCSSLGDVSLPLPNQPAWIESDIESSIVDGEEM